MGSSYAIETKPKKQCLVIIFSYLDRYFADRLLDTEATARQKIIISKIPPNPKVANIQKSGWPDGLAHLNEENQIQNSTNLLQFFWLKPSTISVILRIYCFFQANQYCPLKSERWKHVNSHGFRLTHLPFKFFFFWVSY